MAAIETFGDNCAPPSDTYFWTSQTEKWLEDGLFYTQGLENLCTCS